MSDIYIRRYYILAPYSWYLFVLSNTLITIFLEYIGCIDQNLLSSWFLIYIRTWKKYQSPRTVCRKFRMCESGGNYIRTKIPDFALYIDVVLFNDKTQIKQIWLSMNDWVSYLEQNEHHHHLIETLTFSD
jgi:hypothetical protein